MQHRVQYNLFVFAIEAKTQAKSFAHFEEQQTTERKKTALNKQTNSKKKKGKDATKKIPVSVKWNQTEPNTRTTIPNA